MKPVRKMVVVNVAIIVDGETKAYCSHGPDRMCRFLDEAAGSCILFAKPLKGTEEGYIRCLPCRKAEPA
jgi:hypothetical protein